MRKFIYMWMFILGIGCLISIFIFPVYKINDELILKYNYETYATMTLGSEFTSARDAKDLKQLDKETQKKYKENYERIFKLIDAINTDDQKVFSTEYKYLILNDLYINKVSHEAPLGENSTKAEIELTEKMLQDLYGTEYDKAYSESLNKQFKQFKDSIIASLKTYAQNEGYDDYQEYVIDYGKAYIVNGLLLKTLGLNEELAIEEFDKTVSKGIYVKDLLTSLKKAIEIDVDIYKYSVNQELSTIEKLKETYTHHQFINPFSLLIVSCLFISLMVASVIFIICGIKGMTGRKYPQTFIRSIIFGAIALLIVFGPSFIPHSFLFKYHGVEFSRLLNLVMFTNAGACIYITGISFIIFIALSVVGRFCSFK